MTSVSSSRLQVDTMRPAMPKLMVFALGRVMCPDLARCPDAHRPVGGP